MSPIPFDVQFAVGLLGKMVENPPSDRVMDGSVVTRIREFLTTNPTDPVVVWNFYKHLLDDVVHNSLGSGFVVQILDLEQMMAPPAGGYAQGDGSIHNAPWRLEREK